TIYDNFPDPTFIILAQNKYDGKKWASNQTAFMTTPYGFFDTKSPYISNLYECGMCNGQSDYSFTSLESTVVNAINLINTIIPTNKIKIKAMTTITTVIIVILIIIVIIILIVIGKQSFRI